MRLDNEQVRTRLSRRQLLRIGGLGSLGLTLPGLLQAETEKLTARGANKTSGMARPIRSAILIFYYGGPSHIDTFDMKPNFAPAEIRGHFQLDLGPVYPAHEGL